MTRFSAYFLAGIGGPFTVDTETVYSTIVVSFSVCILESIMGNHGKSSAVLFSSISSSAYTVHTVYVQASTTVQ